MHHIVVTPVYNEEQFLEKYINSIIKQEEIPDKFLLIDDSSNDSSAEIIKKFSDQFEWITYLLHPGEKGKAQGAKIVKAFNYGLKEIDLANVDIISKIDADLELPTNYFTEVKQAFANNRVGIAGGYIIENKQNEWMRIPHPNYHIRGALKTYRKDTFNEINGLMPVLGWDGLDEMKAMYHGWKTQNIEIGVKHFRPASFDYNNAELNFKKGITSYKNGANIFLTIIRMLVKMWEKPYIKSGVMFFLGYLKSMFQKEEKNVDKNLSKFINRFHIKRLLSMNMYKL
ncbi:MAG: glycosyltransferase family 2 protein [Balneolaceae bacterium]